MSQPGWGPPFGERPYGENVFAHELPHAANPHPRYTIFWLIGGWIASYAVATALQAALITVFDVSEEVGAQPSWFLLAGAMSLWVPQLALLVVFSRRAGSGRFFDDFALRFRVVDLWGIPIGVLSQVVLVGVVTWPFREWFPDTFDPSAVEDRARSLYDSAQGIWLIVLALIVVLGAPFVEELLYRGFLQAGLQSRINDAAAIVVVAVWFAGVHGRVAELPGLVSFALVLGSLYYFTRRLGMSVIAHLAFNATGLAFLALT